jgi:glycosyltransferase involved in cell wall biosynthesis
MKRLPVLFLSPVPNFKGGAERSLLDLLANPGVDPFLAVPADGALSAHANELGIPWDLIDFGAISGIRRPFRLQDGVGAFASLLSAARQLNKIACKRGVSLVHSNGLKAHAIALAARRLGGRPAVIHVRDIPNTKVERAFWKALQLAANQTVLVSRACWPAPRLPTNVHIVHNGFISPGGQSNPSLGEDLVLGFTAGRIHPAKGLHALLDGLAKARALGCKVRLVVRGAFAEETPAYEGEIKKKIATLDVGKFVAIEGFVDDPRSVYQGIDVVCVPSTTPDPFPRSVMEAMGHGLVVIAAPCGGIPEMIVDGQTGFLTSDSTRFAAIVAQLQNNPSLRMEIGAKARAYCFSHLGLDRLHAEVRDIYQRVAP